MNPTFVKYILNRIIFNQVTFFTFIAFGLLVILTGCIREETRHSDLFVQIFPDEEVMFRKMELGFTTDTIKVLEPNDPKHEDLLGLTYEYNLGNETELFLEYYTDNLKSRKPSRKVVALVANILLRDEIKSAELYQEIQQLFQQRYGLSSGTFGKDVWTGEINTGRIEARLSLNDQPSGITINFLEYGREE